MNAMQQMLIERMTHSCDELEQWVDKGKAAQLSTVSVRKVSGPFARVLAAWNEATSAEQDAVYGKVEGWDKLLAGMRGALPKLTAPVESNCDREEGNAVAARVKAQVLDSGFALDLGEDGVELVARAEGLIKAWAACAKAQRGTVTRTDGKERAPRGQGQGVALVLMCEQCGKRMVDSSNIGSAVSRASKHVVRDHKQPQIKRNVSEQWEPLRRAISDLYNDKSLLARTGGGFIVERAA